LPEEKKVLIVDENAGLVANLQDILETQGIPAAGAANGKSGLELCRKHSFDVALVDVKLPDTDGLDFIKRLRTVSEGTDCIIMTGHASLESAIQALRDERVVGYETKPLDLDRMLVLIRQILQRKETEQALRYRYDFEKLITSISTQFINLATAEIDAGIHDALERIGRFASADRSYIFRIYDGGTKMDNTHEWCREGLEPQSERLKGLPVDSFPYITERLKRRQTFYVPRVADLPPEAIREKDEFQREVIQSLVCIPMVAGGSLTGFLGFDWLREEKTCSEDVVALLKIVGEIFSSALQRKEAEQALRESERHLKLLLDSLPIGIIVVDPGNYSIVDTNTAAVKMIGASASDIIGSRCTTFIRSTEDGKCPASEPNSSVDNIEGVLMTAKGENVPILRSVVPMMMKGRTHLLESFVDITERKQLEDELRQSQKMKAIGLLAGGIAHDFNNILTGILGYADMLKHGAEPGGRVYNAARTIEKAAERAAELTRQLLGFARKGKYRMLPIDMHDIVREVARLLGRAIDKNVRIRLRLNAKRSVVMGEPTQMQQMLLNLAFNARDAMPGGGELLIETNEVRRGPNRSDASREPHILITVSDTGCGIPDEIQGRIFEPFFTTKNVGKGTGMGLATVYGIVNSHGGSIGVRSKVNQGTTFKVYLPLTDQKAAAKKFGEESENDALVRGTGRILLVDDEKVVRDIAAAMLRKSGYEVIALSSGAEAVKFYRKESRSIDAVILDMIMPEMSGRECFEALKRIDPDVKVILATGYGRNEKAQEIMDKGAVGFIQKPFRATELSAVVAGAVRGANS